MCLAAGPLGQGFEELFGRDEEVGDGFFDLGDLFVWLYRFACVSKMSVQLCKSKMKA